MEIILKEIIILFCELRKVMLMLKKSIECENVKVSILCFAYNHENYIRDTLCSFIEQKTNFKYEILVHDDASTDKTANIIREYEKEYPNVIKPIYQANNIYNTNKSALFDVMLPNASGKYIAFCEGDDYWSDPLKLQKQVNLLDEKLEYIGAFSKILVVDKDDKPIVDYVALRTNNFFLENPEDHKFTIKHIESWMLPGQLSSWIFRSAAINDLEKPILKELKKKRIAGDRILALLLVLQGDLYGFNQIMTHYRYVVNSGTSWSTRMKNKNLAMEIYQECKSEEFFALTYFNTKISLDEESRFTLVRALLFLITTPNKDNLIIFKDLIKSNGGAFLSMFYIGYYAIKRARLKIRFYLFLKKLYLKILEG